MSALRRQILTDYLRLLRPLRALRAMLMTPSKSGHLLLGEAATPFSLSGKLITAWFCDHASFSCTCSTPGLLAVGVPLTPSVRGFIPSLTQCQVRTRFAF
jgi:hypothetical protein